MANKPKLHWTQTPEGKLKASEAQRKRHAKKRKNTDPDAEDGAELREWANNSISVNEKLRLENDQLKIEVKYLHERIALVKALMSQLL